MAFSRPLFTHGASIQRIKANVASAPSIWKPSSRFNCITTPVKPTYSATVEYNQLGRCSARLRTMSTQTTTSTASPLLQLDASYGDWRDDLRNKGYAVVKGAVPHERAVEYQQRALKWLTSFGLPLDLNDPNTWVAENMPVQSKLNTFDNYCVAHEKFMWDARMEPGVVDAFSKVWNTNELLVSFDSLNITLPGRKDKPTRAPWPHVDQSPFKRGLHCIQGIINLSHVGDEDGSLMVMPGSNAHNAEFFDTQIDRSSWPSIDWRRFSKEEIKWFESKGLNACKVKAEPGDLILWDSRTVHWGGEPTANSKTIRTVIYVSYSPAKLATKEALEEKARVFNLYGATTHWAHDNIWLRPQLAHLPDGTLDPRNRDEPLEKPKVNEKMLKLAGLNPY